jgi:GT2 family glycosyltransferase
MAQMRTDRVAAGVVVYNAAEDAADTVRALLASDHPNFEIVVLDNGSTDGSGEVLRSAFAGEPRVVVVRKEPNSGFSGGVNALREELLRTGADYAWILCDDVKVASDAMRLLVEALARDPGIGLAGQTIYHEEARDLVYFSGGWMTLDAPDTGWVEVGHEHGGERDDGAVRGGPVRECGWITGASMFFRAEALRDSGGMDPTFWLYYEDVDLSWRVRKAGWRIAIVPASRAWHSVTPPTHASMAMRIRYSTRNRLLFVERRRGTRSKALALKSLLRFVGERGVSVLGWSGRAVLRGTLDYLLGRTGRIRGTW